MTPLELSNYICNLHNHVAASNGAPTWSCQQVFDFYGFNNKQPERSQIHFWARNWLIFLFLAIHSPQTQWDQLLLFADITGKNIPWKSDDEKILWKKMIRSAPTTRSQAFAWFEEFRPQWDKLYHSKDFWPESLINSPYLRRMRWILTSSQRNNPPALGTWIQMP
jgi:hypothetical protein